MENSIDQAWLGQEFKPNAETGCYVRLSPGGQVTHFGYRQPARESSGIVNNLEVDVEAQRAVETTLRIETYADYDGPDFTTFLEEWRDSAKAADAPKVYKLSCSFCGKDQHEVRKLIAGPSTYICNECVELCSDICASEAAREQPNPE